MHSIPMKSSSYAKSRTMPDPYFSVYKSGEIMKIFEDDLELFMKVPHHTVVRVNLFPHGGDLFLRRLLCALDSSRVENAHK